MFSMCRLIPVITRLNKWGRKEKTDSLGWDSDNVISILPSVQLTLIQRTPLNYKFECGLKS